MIFITDWKTKTKNQALTEWQMSKISNVLLKKTQRISEKCQKQAQGVICSCWGHVYFWHNIPFNPEIRNYHPSHWSGQKTHKRFRCDFESSKDLRLRICIGHPSRGRNSPHRKDSSEIWYDSGGNRQTLISFRQSGGSLVNVVFRFLFVRFLSCS